MNTQPTLATRFARNTHVYRSDSPLHMPRSPFNEVQYDRYTTTARGRTSQGQSATQSARGIPAGPHEACFESGRSGALAGTDRRI